MELVTGVVMRVEERAVWLMAREGRVCRLPFAGPAPAIGDTVTLPPPPASAQALAPRHVPAQAPASGLAPLPAAGARRVIPSRVRRLASVWAVAAALILAMGLTRQWAASRPAVALQIDINPSVELLAGSDLRVLRALARNASGERLLAQVEVRGQPLLEAAENLVSAAVDGGYLGGPRPAVVAALIPLRSGAAAPAERELETALVATLKAKGMKGVYVNALAATPDERSAANRNGLSVVRNRVRSIPGVDAGAVRDGRLMEISPGLQPDLERLFGPPAESDPPEPRGPEPGGEGEKPAPGDERGPQPSPEADGAAAETRGRSGQPNPVSGGAGSSEGAGTGRIEERNSVGKPGDEEQPEAVESDPSPVDPTEADKARGGDADGPGGDDRDSDGPDKSTAPTDSDDSDADAGDVSAPADSGGVDQDVEPADEPDDDELEPDESADEPSQGAEDAVSSDDDERSEDEADVSPDGKGGDATELEPVPPAPSGGASQPVPPPTGP